MGEEHMGVEFIEVDVDRPDQAADDDGLAGEIIKLQARGG